MMESRTHLWRGYRAMLKRRVAGVATLALAAGLASAFALPAAATDDNGSGVWNTYALPKTADIATNASDPDIYRCYGPGSNPVLGWCMVTSQDLLGGTGAYYPMTTTRAFWSADGISWANGTAATESQLPLRTFGNNAPSSTQWPKHLWAPTVAWKNSGNPSAPNIHRVYVPDLVDHDPNYVHPQGEIEALGEVGNWNKYSSRIFVKQTTDLFNAGAVNGANPSVGDKFIQVWTPFADTTYAANQASTKAQYMSDPDVFTDVDGKDYLLWANGDYNNCGQLSMGLLNSAGTRVEGTGRGTGASTNPADYGISVTGVPGSFGTCTDDTVSPNVGNKPLYLEGPSLYTSAELGMWFNAKKYVLVFPIKPQSAPSGCATNNQAIAYATSDTVTGNYAYGGILICGNQNSWTNHGSMTTITTPAGRQQLVFVGHDRGPSPTVPAGTEPGYNRKLRVECMYFTNDQALTASPRTQEGAVSTGTGGSIRNWCLNTGEPIQLKNFDFFTTNSNYLFTNSNGTIGTMQGGSGERIFFSYDTLSGGEFYMTSRTQNLLLSVDRDNLKSFGANRLVALWSTTPGPWERFHKTDITGGVVIFDQRNWVLCKSASSGAIYAEASPNGWTASQGAGAVPTRCKWEWAWLQ